VSTISTRTLQPIAGSERSRFVLVTIATVIAMVAAAVVVAVIGSGSFAAPAPLPSAIPVVEAGEGGEDAHLTEPAVPDVDVVATALPVVTHEVFLSRDPFDPVVPEPVVPVDATDPSNPDAVVPLDPDAPLPVVPVDPDAPLPVVPVDPDAPLPVTGNPDDPRCAGEQELVCDGRVITLIDTTTAGGDPVAIIRVDTTIYEVRVGETFAGTFLLAAIDGSTVTVLYGDESNVLLPGHSVLK
jgi:hypothetical protein